MSMTVAGPEAAEPLEETLQSKTLKMTSVIAERLPDFRRIAKRKLSNAADVEDALQDAFLAAWKHLGQFRGEAQMSTWLTTIVINSSRMVIRKHARARLLPVDGQNDVDNGAQFAELLPDHRPDPEVQFQKSELDRRLQQLSACLPPTLRVVAHLRVFEGLSTRETAEALGMTESAVKSRASRARAILRRLGRSTSRCPRRPLNR
jgi:RNA polymerase sigma-70 factor, ECF subfamily